MMTVLIPNVLTTMFIIIATVFDFWDVVGAPDGTLAAVNAGTVLACEGNRELAIADNDCWAAFVIDMHRVPRGSVLVPF